MNIIISHKSALEYLRTNRRAIANDENKRIRKMNLPDRPPSNTYLKDAERSSSYAYLPLELTYPINIMVGSQLARWKTTVVCPHVYTRQLPDWSFIRVSNKIAVSTPPLCFFQLANDLPLIKLIELGFELCGSYSLQGAKEKSIEPIGADKNIYGCPKLTNTKVLKAFVNRMVGVNGYKKASRALRYIADGSASPMETILFMLLTLPNKLGGFGLQGAELNRRINPKNNAKQRAKGEYYVCDIFWPEANLAIEYDSDTYHTGADRIASDSKKRLNLASYGITVITVTRIQIRNIKEFETLAKLIAKKLGRQFRQKNPQFLNIHRELRNLLL